MVLERPKVLRNPQTGKFVMWMHIDSGDYELARLGVAVSDNPHGPFRYQGSFRPHGQQSRDFTVFAVSLLSCPEGFVFPCKRILAAYMWYSAVLQAMCSEQVCSPKRIRGIELNPCSWSICAV